jgi:hypothetical protein
MVEFGLIALILRGIKSKPIRYGWVAQMVRAADS